MKPMRILHTSDWHLGALLHEQSRLPEQAAFLDWLKQLMATEQPYALIGAFPYLRDLVLM